MVGIAGNLSIWESISISLQGNLFDHFAFDARKGILRLAPTLVERSSSVLVNNVGGGIV